MFNIVFPARVLDVWCGIPLQLDSSLKCEKERGKGCYIWAVHNIKSSMRNSMRKELNPALS